MPPTNDVMIRIKDLYKSFGSLKVLQGISLEVRRGEVVVILGVSGSGKSTMLRCINLLEKPDRGVIQIEDRIMTFDSSSHDLPSERKLAAFRAEAGMVFQQFNLFPHMKVLENVMEGPLTVKRMPRQKAQVVAEEMLEKVGLTEKAGEYPHTLSGGQCQRVAIARALAMKPKVMLFDEVTSALDPHLVGEVLRVIQILAQEGMTMVVVTHEIAFAHQVADMICFLDEGIVVEKGHPRDVLENPTNKKLCEFLEHFHGFMEQYQRNS